MAIAGRAVTLVEHGAGPPLMVEMAIGKLVTMLLIVMTTMVVIVLWAIALIAAVAAKYTR